jgi:hypothetical protein
MSVWATVAFFLFPLFFGIREASAAYLTVALIVVSALVYTFLIGVL